MWALLYDQGSGLETKTNICLDAIETPDRNGPGEDVITEEEEENDDGQMEFDLDHIATLEVWERKMVARKKFKDRLKILEDWCVKDTTKR